MVARDILKGSHPLNKPFLKWLSKRAEVVEDAAVRRSMTEPTVRKARKFLASLPGRGVGYRKAAA